MFTNRRKKNQEEIRFQQTELINILDEIKRVQMLNNKLKVNRDIIRFGCKMYREQSDEIQESIDVLNSTKDSLEDSILKLHDVRNIVQAQNLAIITRNNQNHIARQQIMSDDFNLSYDRLTETRDNILSNNESLQEQNKQLHEDNAKLIRINQELLDTNKARHNKLHQTLMTKSELTDDNTRLRDEIIEKKKEMRVLDGKQSLLLLNLRQHSDILKKIADEKAILQSVIDLKLDIKSRLQRITLL